MNVEWTPAMQAWLEETMSRSRPLSVRQLDVIRPLVREVYLKDQKHAA